METVTDAQGRPVPPEAGGEVETLLGFLEFQRATLAWKCRALSDAQLHATLSPTTMTLAGLLKHLAYVEDHWFTRVVAEQPRPEPWASTDWAMDPDWEWHSAADDSGEQLHRLWEASLERSRRAVGDALAHDGEAAALARTHPAFGGDGRVSLRWVLTHMIEEYARHNGHADLLRESIDGATGE